ncbi:winged helix DNA-binding protein [Sphingomonas sp. AP4-R1]|uniref:winged helix DNA-binding protein n=1 Tax=Sphingomonas sp. AP4-R1 TaxID=2735134 RepID=UPI0014933972|nr:winged helix DNA-binding protein [Sphingomonas sp. AP4-R1]QJU56686.1 winged helix DNA-binding protein [Sphingomonas sp. AP4-R1]
MLPDQLFADPAWDMLLYLVVAEEEGRRSSISRLCRAAAVPTTTALRWIGVLESQDLVRRTPHPSDGRIFVVSLTEKGSADMHGLLATYRLRPA